MKTNLFKNNTILTQLVMYTFCNFLKSTIGRKVLMALTGLVLVLFVMGHMLGNLQIFPVPIAIPKTLTISPNLVENVSVVLLVMQINVN